MKRFVGSAGAVLAAFLAAGVPQAQAQVGVAPYVGYHFDAEEVHLGAAVQFTLPARIGNSQIIASPGFDFYPFLESAPGGSSSLYMLNLDLLYPIETGSPVAPYVGAGLGVSRTSVTIPNPFGPGTSIDVSDTDVGLNLKGGAFFNKGKSIRPFGEAVLLVGNGSTLLLRGGVHIAVGK